jgi:hypothetical protein
MTYPGVRDAGIPMGERTDNDKSTRDARHAAPEYHVCTKGDEEQ